MQGGGKPWDGCQPNASSGKPWSAVRCGVERSGCCSAEPPGSARSCGCGTARAPPAESEVSGLGIRERLTSGARSCRRCAPRGSEARLDGGAAVKRPEVSAQMVSLKGWMPAEGSAGRAALRFTPLLAPAVPSLCARRGSEVSQCFAGIGVTTGSVVDVTPRVLCTEPWLLGLSRTPQTSCLSLGSP